MIFHVNPNLFEYMKSLDTVKLHRLVHYDALVCCFFQKDEDCIVSFLAFKVFIYNSVYVNLRGKVRRSVGVLFLMCKFGSGNVFSACNVHIVG